MANSIVQTNVTQTVAAAPSTLQKTGFFISQGGTTNAAGTTSLLTQMSDLTPILAGAKAITSMILASGTVTVTTTAPHGFPSASTLPAVIAGVTPAAYNGTQTITVTGTSTFTFPLTGTPGAVTVQGTVTDIDVSELVAMATTFFAQGSSVSVLVLELGEGTAAEGVAALSTYVTANPLPAYSYLVPREWANESTYLTFLAGFESTTAKQYFFTTVTLSNYSSFTALMKCVYMEIEAPGIPITEFSLAATFYVTLKYNPSSTNQVPPLAFSFVFGVTPYPLLGNSALLATLKAANVNYVTTGAEGGISNTMIKWGVNADGRPFNYWYSVDWVQINADLTISNVVINGSNNVLAPLYYDQNGIDRLQIAVQQLSTQAVSNGLAVGPVSAYTLAPADFEALIESGNAPVGVLVNAVPFVTYVTQNPLDFPIGQYGGLQMSYTPSRGFTAIIFNVNVSDLVVV